MRSFFYSTLFLVAACGTNATIDGNDQLDTPLGKADTAATDPGGSYTNATPHYGELSTLVLNGDHTFTLSEIGACAGGGTCDPIVETGTYLFTHSTTTRYIRLYADDGSDLDRYAWKLDADGTLELNLDASDHWFSMAADAAPAPAPTCALDTDCTGLLPQFCRACSDGSTACAHWSCVDSACAIASCD